MKIHFLIISFILLSSCDQTYCSEIVNNSENTLTIEICDITPNVIDDGLVNHLQFKDAYCGEIKIKPDSTIFLASATGIRKPLRSTDFGFNKITIKSDNGSISAEGENILDLFDIEPIKNIIGINTGAVYRIRIRK